MGHEHDRALSLRVLWLEDDENLRKAFGFVAEDLGANIHMVASRAEADARLENTRFDCVVCDYRVDGRTTDAFIRRLVDFGHRVVVLTGDASRVPAALRVPVFEKPITVDALLESLVVDHTG